MDLSWLPDGGTGHQVPNEDTLDMWSRVLSWTHAKSILEIGFNAGHSAAIMLELDPEVTVMSVDIGMRPISAKNSKLLEKRYGTRFAYMEMDSKALTPGMLMGRYGLMFIDGDHSYEGVSADFDLAKRSRIPYALLDDLQAPGVKRFVTERAYEFRNGITYDYPSSTDRRVSAMLVRP